MKMLMLLMLLLLLMVAIPAAAKMRTAGTAAESPAVSGWPSATTARRRVCDVDYAAAASAAEDYLRVAELGDPQVSEDYLPIVHLIFSNLKAWLNGVHHGVGQQHLQAYLNEFTFRFNRRFWPMNSFRSLLGFSDSAVRGEDLAPSSLTI